MAYMVVLTGPNEIKARRGRYGEARNNHWSKRQSMEGTQLSWKFEWGRKVGKLNLAVTTDSCGI